MVTIDLASRAFSPRGGVASCASCAIVRRSHPAVSASTLEPFAAASPFVGPGEERGAGRCGPPSIGRAFSLPVAGSLRRANLSDFFDGTIKNRTTSLRQNVVRRLAQRQNGPAATGASARLAHASRRASPKVGRGPCQGERRETFAARPRGAARTGPSRSGIRRISPSLRIALVGAIGVRARRDHRSRLQFARRSVY